MVYGIAKMINFAHGDIIMVGAYSLYVFTAILELPAAAAVILTVAVCAALGIVVERIAYKPLRNAPSLAVLITAIGVSYFLQNTALLIFKATPIPFGSIINISGIRLGNINISGVTLVTFVATAVMMVGLTLFVNKTRAGSAMRAVSPPESFLARSCSSAESPSSSTSSRHRSV